MPDTVEPAHYNCRKIARPPALNGKLDDPVWRTAERTPRFVDMASGAPALYGTHAAALWDDTCLYIGFWVEEPFVRASLTERDSLIFQENDIEVFIDGGDCYYEFEMNALGTIYEVFFIWRDALGQGKQFDPKQWDVLTRNAYTFGGDYDRNPQSFWRGTHPRGARWAFLDWDLQGIRWAVHVEGTINDDSVVDKGWTAEIAFPWESMKDLAHGRSLPPEPGDIWRIFFGRFQLLWNAGKEVTPHPASALNSHGVYDTHRPECFPYVHFLDD